MKKLLTALATSALLLSSVGVASAAARNVPVATGVTTVSGSFTDPSCPGVYTSKTTVTKKGSDVNLKSTTTNDLVYVNMGNSEVQTGSGNDCVVIAAGANGNYVLTNAGKDVIEANSTGNDLETGAGNDLIDSNVTGDYLAGGAGMDTCNYDYMTSYAKQCEL